MFGLERNKDLCVIFVYEMIKREKKAGFMSTFAGWKRKKREEKSGRKEKWIPLSG